MLKEDGTVASTGPFAALRYSNDYIRSLEGSYNTRIEDPQAIIDENMRQKSVEDASELQPDEAAHESEKAEYDSKIYAAAPLKNDKNAGERGKMTSSLPYYIKSLMSISFLLYCSLILLQTACRVVQPLWLRFWTAANARNTNENPGKWVSIYIMFSLLNLGGVVVQYWYVTRSLTSSLPLKLEDGVLAANCLSDVCLSKVCSCSVLYRGVQSLFTGGY